VQSGPPGPTAASEQTTSKLPCMSEGFRGTACVAAQGLSVGIEVLSFHGRRALASSRCRTKKRPLERVVPAALECELARRAGQQKRAGPWVQSLPTVVVFAGSVTACQVPKEMLPETERVLASPIDTMAPPGLNCMGRW